MHIDANLYKEALLKMQGLESTNKLLQAENTTLKATVRKLQVAVTEKANIKEGKWG